IASGHEKPRGTNNCDDPGGGAAECLGRYWYALFSGFLREKRTGIARVHGGTYRGCPYQAGVFMGIGEEGAGLVIVDLSLSLKGHDNAGSWK
ncbi:MAG: hypothetical protein J5476_11935, partial [Lachnospiraceae bacterium]|nr:hypothetical protein [Lachnospiraceae bacterium]